MDSLCLPFRYREGLRRAIERAPGGDLTSKENGYRKNLEQRIYGGPGDRGGVGVPTGHRFWADWCGMLLKAYSWALPGVKRNPMRGHAIAWPRTIPETSCEVDVGGFLYSSG